MSEKVIKVSGLGKQYRIGALRDRRATFREAVVDGLSGLLRPVSGPTEILWALKDVNFEVARGEVVGVIGRNGAGKSTLLKVLSQITYPTEGRVEILGRVASLLEVGTGFHPELTGRENIFLNGAILGMTRAEIIRKFDEIVAFAGVEKFMDTPVKRYSSGMYVRLAFAVAAHLEPEILVVDEVLAVGDIAFQKKCLAKMNDVAGSGRTILFVSHNMGAISNLCSRAILLQDGQITADGPAADVVGKYIESAFPREKVREFVASEKPDVVFQVLRAAVTDEHGRLVSSAGMQAQLCVRLDYIVRRELTGTNLVISVNRDGHTIFASFDIDLCPDLFERRADGRFTATVPIPAGLLRPGNYSVGVGTGYTSVSRIEYHEDAVSFEITADDEDVRHKSFSRASEVAVRIPWHIESAGERH